MVQVAACVATVLLAMVAAAQGSGADADSTLPQAHLPQPAPVWFTFDDYPHAAVVQRMEGNVRFHLTLNPAGRVDQCTIQQSSGYDLLDAETCAILRRRVKLEAPRDADGQALASQYSGTTRWQLPSGQVTPSERHTVWIDVKGGQPSCSVDWNDGRRALKPAICREFMSHLPAGQAYPLKIQVAGRPDEFGFEK